MFTTRVRPACSSDAALRFALPLAAAVLAALAAHVAIDISGDYLLAHDSYDDPGHGSRWLASGALAACAFGALVVLLRTVCAETRGHRGALRAVLRASVPASAGPLCFGVSALTLPLLAAMAWLDASLAGIGVDGVADLFGGSLRLGVAIAVAFACASAGGLHRLVSLLARHHRTIVRAVAAIVRYARGVRSPRAVLGSALRRDRPRVWAAVARCTSGNRAPPRSFTRLHIIRML